MNTSTRIVIAVFTLVCLVNVRNNNNCKITNPSKKKYLIIFILLATGFSKTTGSWNSSKSRLLQYTVTNSKDYIFSSKTVSFRSYIRHHWIQYFVSPATTIVTCRYSRQPQKQDIGTQQCYGSSLNFAPTSGSIYNI